MRNLVYKVGKGNFTVEVKTLAAARQYKAEHPGAIITPIMVEPDPEPVKLSPKHEAMRKKAR